MSKTVFRRNRVDSKVVGKKGLVDYVYFPMILDEAIRYKLVYWAVLSAVLGIISVVFILISSFKSGSHLSGSFPLVPWSQFLLHSFRFGNYILGPITLVLLVVGMGFSYYSQINENRILIIQNNYLWSYVRALKIASIIILLYIAYLFYVYDRARYIFVDAIRDILDDSKYDTPQVDRRIQFEKMQYDLGCCGSVDWRDWNQNQMWEVRAHVGSDNAPTYPYIPPSCCNIHSRTGCLDYVPSGKWPLAGKENWTNNHHMEGCAHHFIHNFNWYVEGAMYAWFALWTFLVTNFISWQYFFTSSHFATIFSMNSQASGFGWLFGPEMDVIALMELTNDITESEVLTCRVGIHVKKGYEHYWENEEQRVPLHAVDKRQLAKMKKEVKIKNGVVASMDGQINYKVSDHVDTLKNKASNLIRSNVAMMNRVG